MPAKYTIEDCQRAAEERGGKCLSEYYVNSHTKMEWECEEEHRWYAPFYQIIAGHWCPTCGKRKVWDNREKYRYSINDYKEFAENNNGSYLSSNLWKCNVCRFEFSASFSSLKQRKNFCTKCIKSQIIVEIDNIIDTKGGKRLSPYLTMRDKIKVTCKEGHIWETPASVIKRGSWCPKCDGEKKKRESRKELLGIIKQKKGILLSEYVGIKKKVKVKCEEGHIWEVIPSHIKSGKWCPICGRKKAGMKNSLKYRRKKLFSGQPFPFFAIDFINLAASASEFGNARKQRITPRDVLKKIQGQIPATPYRAMWFTNNPKTFNILPPKWAGKENGSFNCSYLESSKKGEDDYGRPKTQDIDTMLVGMATSFITEYHNQIERVYLCGGDIDLKPVVIKARHYNLPVTIIAADVVSLNNQLEEMADEIQYLYKTK